jgi:hypothetical protein
MSDGLLSRVLYVQDNAVDAFFGDFNSYSHGSPDWLKFALYALTADQSRCHGLLTRVYGTGHFALYALNRGALAFATDG